VQKVAQVKWVRQAVRVLKVRKVLPDQEDLKGRQVRKAVPVPLANKVPEVSPVPKGNREKWEIPDQPVLQVPSVLPQQVPCCA
jgi:hypothetical protein